MPHIPARAKRVVVLWQGGGPSHVDLFDDKPVIRKMAGQDIPDSVRGTTRLSTMSSGYGKWPCQPAIKPFRRYGQAGISLSEMLPKIGSIWTIYALFAACTPKPSITLRESLCL